VRDSGTGTVVVACFAAGTRIATPDGPVAVEALRIGDHVLTLAKGVGAKGVGANAAGANGAGGAARPVRWIGRRGIDLARHADRTLAEPIRIRKNAIAQGRPSRDLLVSPDHALFLDGALIAARLLVNGASIVRETAARQVVYYHVELDSHDILYAEGLPAESYLDTDNRAMFENGGGSMRLHPDFGAGQAARVTGSCAPLLTAPDAVEKVWRILAERAAKLGWRLPAQSDTTEEPDLHLLAGSRRLKPLARDNHRIMFWIPPAAQPVSPSGAPLESPPLSLASRAARPGDARPWVDDRRLLGVRVRRLIWRNSNDVREIALDDPALNQGWWDVEWDDHGPSRWTNGGALLPPLGAGVLEVELADTMRYNVADADDGCAEPAPARRYAT
jgi:hypothetical protein